MAKKAKRAKKKGPNVLTLLVFLIIGFLAYKANPEYWQQGKLLEDLKKGGVQKVEEEDIANIPDVEPEEYEPEVDPDASLEGSVKGAKTIPARVLKSSHSRDPMYGVIASKFKFVYVVAPSGDDSRALVGSIGESIKAEGLRDSYKVKGFYYDPSTKKQDCSVAETVKYFCDECDRKACIINGKAGEYMVLPASEKNVIAKIKQLSSQDW